MKKSAFTLIEIIFSIVVMGIVAMIGTNIITHMYEGYIKSKVVNKLQVRTEEVADIIAKRLEYRIKDSTVASKDGVFSTYKKLSESGIDQNYTVLEWIGYDNEGMIGEWDNSKKRFSGWSGFIDIDKNSSKTKVVSSVSRFDLANYSIKALSYDAKDINNSAIIFRCNHNMNPMSYGFMGGSSNSNIYKISTLNDQILFKNNSSKDICEQYYLVWTAYAIVPEGVSSFQQNNKKISDFNLTLKYDYQPWNGETYKNAKSAVLSEHVTTFRFIQYGHTLRFKLCLRDPQTSYGFCKERAVW